MKKLSFDNQKSINNALNLLKNVTNVLDDNDIEYYLDFGTLLGAVRDKGFIPWDNDIDISLLDAKDYKKIPSILEELKNKHSYKTKIVTFKQSQENRVIKGKKLYYDKIDFTDENNYHIAKIKSYGLWKFGRANAKLDIFFKYEDNGYLYWLADGQINRVKKDFLDEGLTIIDFYNRKFKIPKNYDKYLTEIYGNWRKPNKEWIESDGVCNISAKKGIE
jgi:lipopolysaccharide cholinephosphotransferase